MWQQILRKQQRDQWLQLIWGAQAYLRLSKIDFSSLSGSLHNPYKIRPTTNWKTAIIADFGLGRAPSVIFECCYFFNFHFVFLYILHFRISIDQGFTCTCSCCQQHTDEKSRKQRGAGGNWRHSPPWCKLLEKRVRAHRCWLEHAGHGRALQRILLRLHPRRIKHWTIVNQIDPNHQGLPAQTSRRCVAVDDTRMDSRKHFEAAQDDIRGLVAWFGWLCLRIGVPGLAKETSNVVMHCVLATDRACVLSRLIHSNIDGAMVKRRYHRHDQLSRQSFGGTFTLF